MRRAAGRLTAHVCLCARSDDGPQRVEPLRRRLPAQSESIEAAAAGGCFVTACAVEALIRRLSVLHALWVGCEGADCLCSNGVTRTYCVEEMAQSAPAGAPPRLGKAAARIQ